MSTQFHSRPAAATARLLPILLLLLGLFLSTLPAHASEPTVVVGAIDDAITPVMARYVERTIERAERNGAAAVVFTMDTPGGLSSAMDDIVRSILESEVPVVVYVSPRQARAASAGVYITYAAHVAAMAPGTNIGSASPVFIGADGSASDGDETMKNKVTNDAVAQITNLAELRGRNVEWAVKAVRDADNITADEALALGVIDVVSPSLDELLAVIDGRTVQLASGPITLATAGARTSTAEMTLVDRLFQLLADPTIAYLLVSLGLLGIYVEFSSPGLTLPGIGGGIALLLGLVSLGTLPVNWAGLALIVFAFILLAIDVFVASAGILTIGGIVAFIAGSYMLLSDQAPPGFEIARPAIWSMAASLLAFSLLLGYLVLRARIRPPATGAYLLLGAAGVVREPLTPRGTVLVRGELWDASVGESAAHQEVGARVIVESIDGLHLQVRPALAGETGTAERQQPDRRFVVPRRPAFRG